MSAEDRLADYIAFTECLAPIMAELKKLDIDAMQHNANMLDIVSVQLGVQAIVEVKENAKYYLDFYTEKINGLREYVRGLRAKEQEAQEREYRSSP